MDCRPENTGKKTRQGLIDFLSVASFESLSGAPPLMLARRLRSCYPPGLFGGSGGSQNSYCQPAEGNKRL